MMKALTEEQVEFIKNDVLQKGVTMENIADSLLDHICCVIEGDSETDFDIAYAKAIAAFGESGLIEVQRETQLLLTHKKVTAMRKLMYILGFIAAILSTTGILFKLQHWPGAAVMLVLGIVLLNFGYLPMYFYDRYKRSAV